MFENALRVESSIRFFAVMRIQNPESSFVFRRILYQEASHSVNPDPYFQIPVMSVNNFEKMSKIK